MRPPIVSHVIDFVKWKHPANHKQTEWKMQHANCCKCPVESANHVQTMYNVSSPGQLGTDFASGNTYQTMCIRCGKLTTIIVALWKQVETMCKSYIHYYARRKLQKLCKPYFVSAQRRVRKPCANLYDDDVVVVVVGLSSYTVVLIVLLHMQTLCKQIANK
jgi:hypothetical protein